jgi:hypothetical protein
MKARQWNVTRRFCCRASALTLALLLVPLHASDAQKADYVIQISVDGLRPDAVTALGPTNLPNFYRMRAEGVFTDNARTDYDYTVTLPNHVTQLTGRGVVGAAGHNWTDNGDPDPGETLASNKGSYIAGVFDVAHDNGLRTGEYASKSKFSLFATSWDATNGAPDTTGPDNGRNKIDVYVNTEDTSNLVGTLVADMTAQPFHYVFFHLRDPDSVGHGSGWDITPGSDYCTTIKTMDNRLGAIFSLIDNDPRLTNHTAVILTADHGGSGADHGDPTLPEDYTVPFYVWGPGVISGGDLYALNASSRHDPGTNRPPYSDPVQPIRNGEAANVALTLLGLGPVPGSTIDTNQDLVVTVPGPQGLQVRLIGADAVLSFTTAPNLLYDVQARNELGTGSWSNSATNIAGTGGIVTNVEVGAAAQPQRFYRIRPHF